MSRLPHLRSLPPHRANLFTMAQAVEGYTRHTSIHAAGVVIAPEPMAKFVPLYYAGASEKRSAEDQIPCIQWDMYDAEDRGLLKMDFLGLKTLRVIDPDLPHEWWARRPASVQGGLESFGALVA